MTFSNPFCHRSDRNDPRKPAYHAGESNSAYHRHRRIRESLAASEQPNVSTNIDRRNTMTIAITGINRSELPPLLSALGGGFYMGLINHNGQPHAVIRAPKAEGHFVDVAWGEYGQKVEGADSYTDGLANTIAMAEAGSELARKILALKIGGAKDWALPARDQLELCYRAAKPTAEENYTYRSGENPSAVPPTHAYTEQLPAQTADALFQDGGAESFDDRYYWSSTQFSAINAWHQNFNDGYQYICYKSSEFRAFAVRMIPVIE